MQEQIVRKDIDPTGRTLVAAYAKRWLRTEFSQPDADREIHSIDDVQRTASHITAYHIVDALGMSTPLEATGVENRLKQQIDESLRSGDVMAVMKIDLYNAAFDFLRGNTDRAINRFTYSSRTYERTFDEEEDEWISLKDYPYSTRIDAQDFDMAYIHMQRDILSMVVSVDPESAKTLNEQMHAFDEESRWKFRMEIAHRQGDAREYRDLFMEASDLFEQSLINPRIYQDVRLRYLDYLSRHVSIEEALIVNESPIHFMEIQGVLASMNVCIQQNQMEEARKLFQIFKEKIDAYTALNDVSDSFEKRYEQDAAFGLDVRKSLIYEAGLLASQTPQLRDCIHECITGWSEHGVGEMGLMSLYFEQESEYYSVNSLFELCAMSESDETLERIVEAVCSRHPKKTEKIIDLYIQEIAAYRPELALKAMNTYGFSPRRVFDWSVRRFEQCSDVTFWRNAIDTYKDYYDKYAQHEDDYAVPHPRKLIQTYIRLALHKGDWNNAARMLENPLLNPVEALKACAEYIGIHTI